MLRDVGTRVTAVLIFYGLLCGVKPEEAKCPNYWKLYTNKDVCIGKFYQKRNWSEARETCTYWGGDLVTIKDDDKFNNVIADWDCKTMQKWIGMHDLDKDGWIEDVKGEEKIKPVAGEGLWSSDFKKSTFSCVSLGISPRGLQTQPCEDKLCYVCERDLHVTTTTTTTTTAYTDYSMRPRMTLDGGDFLENVAVVNITEARKVLITCTVTGHRGDVSTIFLMCDWDADNPVSNTVKDRTDDGEFQVAASFSLDEPTHKRKCYCNATRNKINIHTPNILSEESVLTINFLAPPRDKQQQQQSTSWILVALLIALCIIVIAAIFAFTLKRKRLSTTNKLTDTNPSHISEDKSEGSPGMWNDPEEEDNGVGGSRRGSSADDGGGGGSNGGDSGGRGEENPNDLSDHEGDTG